MTELVTVWHGALWREDRPVVIPPKKRGKWAHLIVKGRQRNKPKGTYKPRLCAVCGKRHVQELGLCRRCFNDRAGLPTRGRGAWNQSRYPDRIEA